MRKNILSMRALIFLPLFIYSSISVFSQTFPENVETRLQTVIDSLVENDDDIVAGMSVAVLKNGETFWEGASGLSSMDDPESTLNPDSLFVIYSITKTFTSALILDLMSEGKLSLDDEIYKHIPGWNFGFLDSTVSIRQLLNHQSGFNDYATSPLFALSLLTNPSKIWTPMEVIAFVGAPVHEKGVDATYSSTSYLVLGMIAESVTGKPYHESIRERYFEKLGMEDSYVFPAETPEANMANPHDNMSLIGIGEDKVTDISKSLPIDGVISAAWAAGGIISTAEDIARWGYALYSGKATSQTALDTMLASLDLYPKFGYGINRSNYEGIELWGHNGGAVGYSTSLAYLPDEKISIAIMLNQGLFTNNSGLRNTIGTAFYREITENVLAVAELNQNQSIRVFPNPAKDLVNISLNFTNPGALTIELFDLSGKKLLSENDYFSMSSRRTRKLGIDNLQKGIYLLKVANAGDVYAQKLVVE